MTTRPKILIANRGEIAIRIAQSIREFGGLSVGIYTDSEPHGLHLKHCDFWIKLEGKTNQETYLNIDAIIDLCEKEGISAVHPGYGFLSENADFVERLEEKNIIFIGPSAQAIRSMGDKATSKEIAKKAKIPVVPGSIGNVATIDEALKIAQEIKYPVLLKAVHGGGGRGMRICRNDEEVKNNFESVRREAKTSFGKEDLLVEKYIVNPHHIEVQILGDKKGNIFHFFERECSVQRRHQKVVEEAPSPFIGEDEKLRESICTTAVDLAKAVGYYSAGTVEFIMGEDKSFYFLEMNTRIQVEHPITEEITSSDLLLEMLNVAFSSTSSYQNQQQITRQGHAIECRICAEDPVTLLPAPGKVLAFNFVFPQWIRFDHCLYEGMEITPDFDPMVGKLIARAQYRSQAIKKLQVALERLDIQPLKNNIQTHLKILSHPRFISGKYSTHFMEEDRPHLGLNDERPDDLFYLKSLLGHEMHLIHGRLN